MSMVGKTTDTEISLMSLVLCYEKQEKVLKMCDFKWTSK